MDNQFSSPINSLNSQIKDSQYKSQSKKQVKRPQTNKRYTLVYSIQTNGGGLKP